MLQIIREYTQGWIASVIIFIIILTFALWGIHSYFISGENNRVVAYVNSDPITREQLTVAYERLRRQAQAQGVRFPLSSKDEALLKERALNILIEIAALKQASIKQGFFVSNRQVDNYLQGMPEFQVNGQFSIERFQDVLSTTTLATSEFLDLIKTSLLVDQPRLGILLSSFSLDQETNYTISLVNQLRQIEYISLPFNHFDAKTIQVPDTDIQSYYDAHSSEFMTPEQVNIDYLELSTKDILDSLHPDESVLKNFYNENINAYTQGMKWKVADIQIPFSAQAGQEEIAAAQTKIDAIKNELAKGEDFFKLARSYTQTLNGQTWLTLGQIPSELQKALAGLNKPGQVSEPIKTTKGFVILFAVAIDEPKIQSFALVKNQVRDAYLRQMTEEKFAEMRERLADLVYEHPESLQFAAKTLHLPVKVSELFTKNQSGKGVAQSQKVRDVAFSSDMMELQNNSDVIQLNADTVIVLRVKSHLASKKLPLKEVSAQIQAKLKLKKIELQTKSLAETIKQKLEAGSLPQAMAKEYQLLWQQAGYLGRYATKIDSAILDTAFRLPHPQSAHPVVYGITRLPNGYAIVVVKAVKNGQVDDKKQFAIFTEQVQNSEGLLEYQLYKLSQLANSKITMS